jgi:hypothetical protein
MAILTVHHWSDKAKGLGEIYWRRPAAYLDPRIRAAISSFWALGDVSAGLNRLERDLASGAWARLRADLLDLDEHDFGYRLVVTR